MEDIIAEFMLNMQINKVIEMFYDLNATLIKMHVTLSSTFNFHLLNNVSKLLI